MLKIRSVLIRQEMDPTLFSLSPGGAKFSRGRHACVN